MRVKVLSVRYFGEKGNIMFVFSEGKGKRMSLCIRPDMSCYQSATLVVEGDTIDLTCSKDVAIGQRNKVYTIDIVT